MSRPFIQLGVGELEALFAKSRADVEALKQLVDELQYRQVPRAVALLARVKAEIHGTLPSKPAASSPKPKQPELWELPPSIAPGPVESSPPPPRPEKPAIAPTLQRAAKPSHPASPVLPLQDAYKLLRATPASTWESIEHIRRQLVQESYPTRLKSLNPEQQVQALADAKKVNAAYAVLSEARCSKR